MNRLTRQALLLASLGALTLPAEVQAQFILSTNNGQINIVKYTGSDCTLTIPSTTNGLPVTSIGICAFRGCTSLSSVTIPNSVTSIGDFAFYDCIRLIGIGVNASNQVYSSVGGVLFNKRQTTLIQYPNGKAESSYAIPSSVTSIGSNAFINCRLTSVMIPSSVTSVSSYAFNYCPNLTSVPIPASVTSIGPDAFYECPRLTAITVDVGNPVYSSLDGVLLSKSQTMIIQYPEGGASDYTIPNRVTSIGSRAFSGCHSLSSVTIPSSVTNIGNNAFNNCTRLANICIGTNVTSIGSRAFSACTSLTFVTIPHSVTSIGPDAFYHCTSLTAITVDVGNPVYSSLDDALFNKNQTMLIQYPREGTTHYTIPRSVTSIGGRAFSDCTSLTSVTIPSSVTNIGCYGFDGCGSLASITIPSSVTSLGSGAFNNCTRLTGIYFEGNAPRLEDKVFEQAYKATIYYLPGTTGWSNSFGGRVCVTVDAREDIILPPIESLPLP